ncbi:hypothetical protein CIL05_00565 [Virgibacillus profundi]|uniref:ABC transporter substrate-binding protein n=1 Tax=Virgibacillus profundi TaxID=2024555 RepID=A0A2A2IHS8_9BACI|nr:extracellular solute-binding protein [Virgibacillus profundi]PAV31187.1 hypothetical protein CIL05_00565 [Virgibacillus profundi]PXY55369.1 ABC transporter substrate-binding protein [Virgibacillus profundi]
MKNHRYLFLLVIALVLIIATGCAQDEEGTGETSEENLANLNETGFPVVDDSITLDFFARQAAASNDNWNDVLMFNEYEEMTNIDINWQMVPGSSFEEKFNLALGSNDLPDAFHSAGVNNSELLKYGEQGIFTPLNDLIDEYAPNFKKIMEEYPNVKEMVTMADGNIYSFPFMNHPEFLSKRIAPYPFINQDWLDELGMDVPETTEDYYQYLKAVKEENPSNGKVDEIPFGGHNVTLLYNYLKGAFGIANKGLGANLIDLDPETNDYRFYPTSDQYKELLEYLNKLYDEELIEKNIFSIDPAQYAANASEGRYGSFVWYGVPNKEDNYVGMPALEGPHGDKLFTDLKSPVENAGAFIITNKNENPEATVRWIDHFYGEEGMKLFFMGVEGETYEIDEDGNPVYLKEVYDEEKDDTSVLKEYLTFGGGLYPALTEERYFIGAETTPEALEATEKVKPDVIKDPWANIKHTEEEVDQLQGFGSDIE